MNIKNIPLIDRPIEKLFCLGKENLTDTELIAIIINSGYKEKNSLELAREVYQLCDAENSNKNVLEKIYQLNPQELQKIKGLGVSKVARLLAGMELGRRISQSSLLKDKSIYKCPEDIARWFRLKYPQFT